MTTNITIPLATLEQLVVALEPFARDAEGIHPDWSSERRRASLTQERPLTVGDFRKARNAITAGRAALEGAELAEPMIEVADRYAHRLALELECVLADRHGYYNTAMQVLGEYREAMNAIHERHSPTFMGEPLIHADHHGPDWTQRDWEYLK